MIILIGVCLVLITVAVVFGAESAQGLIGCALTAIFWLFILGLIIVVAAVVFG